MILNKIISIVEVKGLFFCIKYVNKCVNREDLFGI